MNSWTPTKHTTTNWSAYNEASSLSAVLSGLPFAVAEEFEPGAVSRPAGHCAAMSREGIKVLFGMALRQTTGFVESLLKRVGLDWTVPDFSSLCRRQRTLNVSIPSHRCKQRLPGNG